MAKELPFFKFEPSEWDNGNIQMCCRESKGLFIELCSIYWSRLGELPYALALQKLCNGSKDAMQELIDHEIIGINEGKIVIQFLDEQLEEFSETVEKRRNAANKRWNDARALQEQSISNATRQDKTRQEKTKQDKTTVPVPFLNGCLIAWNDWVEHRKQLRKPLTQKAIEKQIQFLRGRAENEIILILNTAIEKNWQGLYEVKNNNHGTKISTTGTIRTTDAIIEQGKDFGIKTGF